MSTIGDLFSSHGIAAHPQRRPDPRRHPGGRTPAVRVRRLRTDHAAAVAADVGVDPALVIRYFGSKQDLFAAAAEFTLDLPDLTAVHPDDVADALLPSFFAVWEDDTTFVALLRAAMTSPTAADTMRRIFATQVAPKLAAVTPDHPAQRAGLMGAFVIGLATTRYVLANPAVADLSHDELIGWARPVIRQLLVGPAPG